MASRALCQTSSPNQGYDATKPSEDKSVEGFKEAIKNINIYPFILRWKNGKSKDDTQNSHLEVTVD